MRAEHLSKEATRLAEDDTLQLALSDMRAEALEALATCAPNNVTAIVQAQARVAAVDEFRSQLRRYIIRRAGTEQGASPYV